MLLGHGADANAATSDDGWTALIMSAFAGHTAIVTVGSFLPKGAGPNDPKGPTGANRENK